MRCVCDVVCTIFFFGDSSIVCICTFAFTGFRCSTQRADTWENLWMATTIVCTCTWKMNTNVHLVLCLDYTCNIYKWETVSSMLDFVLLQTPFRFFRTLFLVLLLVRFIWWIERDQIHSINFIPEINAESFILMKIYCVHGTQMGVQTIRYAAFDLQKPKECHFDCRIPIQISSMKTTNVVEKSRAVSWKHSHVMVWFAFIMCAYLSICASCLLILIFHESIGVLCIL